MPQKLAEGRERKERGRGERERERPLHAHVYPHWPHVFMYKLNNIGVCQECREAHCYGSEAQPQPS